MKKTIVFVCILAMVSFLCAFAQNAEQLLAQIVQLRIFVDGTEKSFSSPIVTINDRTYIPLREVAETLGMNVEWNDKAKKIDITTKKQENREDLFIFSQNEKYGYMDRNGNIIVDAQFNWASDFTDGAASVGNYIEDWKNYPAGSDIMRYGLIDGNGKMITPVKFLSASSFNEGLALVREVDGSSYYIDKDGNKSPQKVISDKFFTKGFAPKLMRGGFSGPPMPNPPSEVWSYIDSNGELATDKEFEEAREFSDDLAIVKNNGKYGIIDTNFNIAIDYKYDGLLKVDTALFAAKKGEKWGLINTSDKVIVDFDYFNIGSFSEGLASVSKARINGALTEGAYIDKNGKITFDLKFQLTSNFIDGFACVCDKDNGKYGVIDRSGKYVIEPKYYYLNQQKSGLIMAKDQAGMDYYYIDLQENKVIPH